MKHILLSGKKILSFCALSTLFLSSCTSDDSNTPSNSGKISLLLTTDTTIERLTSRSAEPDLSSLNSIHSSDLAISLTESTGYYSSQWNSIDEFPADDEFPVGSYTMTASCGDESREGFNAPQFYGETTFSVTENHTSSVALTAKVANSLVLLDPTENFSNYFTSVKLSVETEAGHAFVINTGETRPLFVNPGSTTINADVVLPSGKEASLTLGSFDAKVATLHRITLDVDKESGDASLSVKFDDSLDSESVEIPLSDEIIDAPAPLITPEGFTDGQTIDMIVGNKSERLQFNIAARAGLGEAYLYITNGSLETKFNLLDRSVSNLLTSSGVTMYGFEADKKKDTFAKIDITDYISSLNPSEDTELTYRVEAKDKFNRIAETETGAQSASVTVKAHPETLTLSFLDPEKLALPEIKFNCNEADVWAKKASFSISTTDDNAEALAQAINNGNILTVKLNDQELNQAEEMTYSVTSLTPATTYKLTGSLSIPSFKVKIETNMDDLGNKRLTLNQTDSKTLTFDVISTEKVTDDKYVHILEVKPISSEQLKFFGKTSHQRESNELTTPILVRAFTPTEFTTEAASPLPNSDLEDWEEPTEKGKYWKVEVPESWGTMNKLTTSSRNGTDGTTYSYVATSGTIPSNDCKSGTYAALIRTVGWGANNSAPSLFQPNFGTCNNATAGELYLGQYDNGAKYGIPFASRPSKISFYFKYKNKHSSDRGIAIIRVKDSTGNTITEKECILEPVDKYEQRTLSLDYPNGASIAASLEVIFKSSNQDVSNKRNKDWLTPPSDYNLGTDEYVGSELYIDDIELHY